MAESVGKRGQSWFYRVELPPGPDGKRRQKRVAGFRTEREAKHALAKAQVDIGQGRLRYSTARTVSDLADEWLAAVEPNRKASTFENYQLLMKAYVVRRVGSLRLDRLTPTAVQRLYADLRASGGRGGRPLSGTQVRNIHRVLHTALSYAERMGYIARNPADVVEKPREDTGERTVYTPQQVKQFVAALETDRLRALWYLALSAGLRRGELAGLQWRDVDLDGARPKLAVRTTRTAVGNRVVLDSPKSRASRRVIYLDSGTTEVLRQHRADMLAEAELRGESVLPRYVFVDEWGEPYKPDRLTRSLHALQQRARLPEITLHDLRHTAATIALLAGVHPKVVSERHGHASTQITLDRYSHVVEAMQQEAADAIGKFLQAT
jgi:integrase